MKKMELENLDVLAKQAWLPNGTKVFIGPHEIKLFDEETANVLLSAHPRYVKEYNLQTLPTVPGDPIAWVANMTGNESLPQQVKRLELVEGKEKYHDAPNTHRNPTPLRFTYFPPQLFMNLDTDKASSFSPLPVHIKIPPYTRMATSSQIAYWLANEANTVFQECDAGRLKIVRAPSAFEPNSSWGYDDMRLYANMVDSEAFSKESSKGGLLAEGGMFPPGRTLTEPKRDELRLLLWQRLFFYIIDDRYALPSKEAFDNYKTSLVKNKIEASKEISNVKKSEVVAHA